MASAVEGALRDEQVLLCEAGTGTGKTLAYLVPALLSGKRVVVSTATKALQEQIAHKDVPLIARTLGIAPRVVVMKGLANYVCKRRYHEFQVSVEALRPRYSGALTSIGQWVDHSETGEIAELAALREHDPIWHHVTSSSDTRIGAACTYFDECFVTRMRREAEAAQLIVVNHHLFFADLALRGPHPASVLPDYDAVVFDEAHQIEDVAGMFFGQRISRLRSTRLVGELKRWFGNASNKPQGLIESLERSLERLWELLLSGVTGPNMRITLERDAWTGTLREVYFDVDRVLEAVATGLQALELPSDAGTPTRSGREVLDLLARRVVAFRDQLTSIVDGAPGTVTWLEATPPALSSTPVNLGPVLRERVFSSIPSVILTSATLTTKAGRSEGGEVVAAQGGFGYVRQRLGLSDEFEARQLTLESPFDFQNKALLYTPRDLPPARSPAFLERAAERVVELVNLTSGGAFVLTTSLASMRRIHQLIEKPLGQHTVLLQGQAPKQALLSSFRASGDAVLVATQSFWEGVDIPGQALRLVVLEKLPFAVPTDPVVKARALAIERNGGNPFMDLFVPGAAISLKQGFGRLIRTNQDTGVVALFDERVHTKGYSKRLLSALPPVRRTSELAEVAQFWTTAALSLSKTSAR